MKISLENYLKNKLDEVEIVHSFELATDTIRCWIDEYIEQLHQCNVVRQTKLCEHEYDDGGTSGWHVCRKCGDMY